MDPTFTPEQVQQILARLRAGESVPGWTYGKTDPGWGFQNDNEVWNEGGESIHYDISPTRRQGFNLDGTASTPVFNPGEGYRRSVKYVEPLALAAFGTALGYGLLNGAGAAGAAGSSGTAGASSAGLLGDAALADAAAAAASGTTPEALAAWGSSAGVGTGELAALGGATPAASTFTPSMNYGPGMTGAQTSVYDAVVGATGSPGLANTAANVTGPLSKAAEWMKANPTAGRLLMSGVSGLLSASGGSSGGSGGYKDSGYRPTVSRGGWQPSVTPRSMALTPTSINLPTTGQPNSGLWRYGLLGG